MLGFFISMNQNEIRELRIAAGLSLESVARLLGRTRQWLSRVETGKIPASRSTLARIGKVIRRIDGSRVTDFSDLRLPRRSPARKHVIKSQAE